MLKHVCALMLFSAGLAQAGPAVLQVTDDTGEPVASFPLEPGQRWCLSWNHSVAGFTVRDCFAWRPPELVLTDSHQPDFAAGLGHIQGRGMQRSDGAGGYRIEHIDQALPDNRLALRVGSTAVDHRIDVGGRVHSLSATHAGRKVVLHMQPPASDQGEYSR